MFATAKWNRGKAVRDDATGCLSAPQHFHSPEPYFEALKKLHPIIQRIDMKKIFADGNDVCVLYDLVTNTPIGTAFVCEWYQVKGDKISSVRTVFDARPFAAMFAGKAAK